MDRDEFLQQLREAAVKVHPVPLPGWGKPVYIKPLTLGEIQQRMDDPRAKALPEPDPYRLARTMADLVHDESGRLLFDRYDEAQMSALHEVMQEAPAPLLRILQEEQAKLAGPTDSQVDASGN